MFSSFHRKSPGKHDKVCVRSGTEWKASERADGASGRKKQPLVRSTAAGIGATNKHPRLRRKGFG